MSINLVYYSNTFADWVTTTNLLVSKVNLIDTGDYVKSSGTLVVSTPSDFTSTLGISGRTIFTSNNVSFTTGIVQFSNTANVVFSTNTFFNRVVTSNNTVKLNNIYANGNVWFGNTSTIHFPSNNLITNLNSQYLGGENSSFYISITNTATTEAQSAFLQANTGVVQAQAAFGRANLVFTQANTATTQAQAAFGQANTAFGQANTATTQAQAAFGQANTATTQAQAAFGQANTATTQAQAAFGQANTATTQAQAAFGQANTATTQAQAAFGQANTATTQAQAAFGQANTATTQAQAAFGQANTATTQAQAAFGQANTATTQAQAAFTKANTTNLQLNSLGVGVAASGTTGEIIATNNITAYYSDDRLKHKLGDITEALDKVCSLSGFYYEANEIAQSLGYTPKKEVGVSAQQVQAVLPEIVVPAPIDDQYLTVRYEKLIPLLIEAIKELSEKVTKLEESE